MSDLVPEKMTDAQLINLLVRDQTNNVPIGELTRRNTEAINKFNRQSSFLSWAMISLAVISVLISVAR